MAATASSIAFHIPKHHLIITSSSSSKPASLHASQPPKPSNKPQKPWSLAKSLAVASTVISPLTSSSIALAAKQLVESPQEDNRGLILLVPVAAAVGWVLFNILGPALNQLNRMRNEKMTVIGLGGLLTAASAGLFVPAASAASEVVEKEAASGGGSNSGLLALIVAAAVGFEVVLLNTMQSEYEEKEGASD